MMSEIRLRPAADADAPVIHRLLLDLAADLGKASDIRSTAEDIRRFGFGDDPRFEAILAFDGDRPVGLVLFFYEFSTWRGTPGAYVQDLYVAPAARQYGLGRRLMEAAMDRAREREARYMRLTVYDGNRQALDFYHALGFELCANEQVLVRIE